ncbi:ATP-binding protein [Flavobacteriaceae bacterium]|nr:ATP-binding protein [Flavobacteriaceae bacterium]
MSKKSLDNQASQIAKLEQQIEMLQEKLRVSETNFGYLYDNNPVMHATINPLTGYIVNCNSMLVSILGYKNKKSILGTHISKIVTEKSSIKIVSLMDAFLSQGPIDSEEVTLKTKKGKSIQAILNSRAIYNKAGIVVKSIFTLVDISEVKKAQRQAKNKKEDLERVNKDLEQFVSICSHDLQEPLATIRFSSDFLMQKFTDDLSEKGKEYIGYIHEASGRMAEQIKGLLEHSRIGRDLKLTKVDMQEQLEVAKYDLKKRIKETNATIICGELPKIKGYKVELRLLFQNLLSNALKYAKKQVAPIINIAAKQEDDYWVFSVADNGIGIKEQDMEDLFTIFSRVPTKQKQEGSGVGLAHAEKIVKLHEGFIWVESEFGKGSTFYFKIKK